MKLAKFPFDSQTCTIGFFLMDYSPIHVSIKPLNETLQYFDYSNDEWDLTRTYDQSKSWNAKVFLRKADRSWERERPNNTYIGRYNGFEVWLTFQRHPAYYIFNIILPVLIISAIGFISVFIPSNSGDRINLSMTVLLGFIFIQSLMATLVPKVATSPHLANYVLQAMFLSAVNIVACVLVIGIHNLASEPHLIIKIIFIRILGSRLSFLQKMQKEK